MSFQQSQLRNVRNQHWLSYSAIQVSIKFADPVFLSFASCVTNSKSITFKTTGKPLTICFRLSTLFDIRYSNASTCKGKFKHCSYSILSDSTWLCEEKMTNLNVYVLLQTT